MASAGRIGAYRLGQYRIGWPGEEEVSGVTGSILSTFDDDTTNATGVATVLASANIVEGNDTSTSNGVVGGSFQPTWARNTNILIGGY